MAVIKELIRVEQNNTLSFGNYRLTEKTKLSDFQFQGDVYKVKTFHEITRLECNGAFAYESVPGTAVLNYNNTEHGVSFVVDGYKSTQITMELEEEMNYDVYLDDVKVDELKTNIGGKLAISLDLEKGREVSVKVQKR